MNRSMLPLVASLMVFIANAGEVEDKVAHWVSTATTAADRSWTKADNWSDGIIPGRYGTSGENGSRGWTAILDGGSTWLMRVQGVPYSISNVIFSSGTKLTTIGSGDYDYIPLEVGGMFRIASAPAGLESLTVMAYIKICEMIENSPIHIRNDSAATLMNLRGFKGFTKLEGVTGTCYPEVFMEGCGRIRLRDGFAAGGYRADITMAMDEGGCLQITNSVGNLRTVYVSPGVPKQTIEIFEGSKLMTGSQTSSRQVDASSDIDFIGSGTLQINSTGTANGGLYVANGTIDISCTLAQGSTAEDASFKIHGSTSGTVRIRGENLVPQNPLVSGVALEVATMGNSGESSALGLGDGVGLSGNARLRYVGAGETCNRALDLFSKTGVVEQAGTGILDLQGTAVASAWQSALVLLNNTDVKAVYSGVIKTGDYDLNVIKRGSGEWMLSGANTTKGMFTLESGTLTAGNEDAFHKLTLDGEGCCLKVIDGIALNITTFYREKGSVNVVTGSGASVRIKGLPKGRAPEWLTLNGAAATVGSDGLIKPLLGLILMFR